MKKNAEFELSFKAIKEIKKLAREQRCALGFGDEAPIANDLEIVLEKRGITLLEFPIQNTSDSSKLSGVLYCNGPFVFIGINTNNYYDNQIFTIAHELYHYYTESGSRLCWHESNASEEVEVKANWFAAEFLLPQEVLKRRIAIEFGSDSLQEVKHQALLRFLARLHSIWYLPYQVLVNRLKDLNVVTEIQYQELSSVDARDSEGIFHRIGHSIQPKAFAKLNAVTKTIGASPYAIETIVRNFEHDVIDEQTFADTLKLFNKSPADFGYEILISQDDLDEIDDFLESWVRER